MFTIDVAAYAIMSNHYHLVLHVDRAKAQNLTDHEVSERWCRVFIGSKIVEHLFTVDDYEVDEYKRASATMVSGTICWIYAARA